MPRRRPHLLEDSNCCCSFNFVREVTDLKSFSKSRNGCKECKRRKVKCDEAPLICGACRKNGVTCSFTELHSPPTASEEGSANQTVTFTPNSLLDLELLHHFTLKTSASFTAVEDLHRFYREDLVQHSFPYEWMLHTILALSAFHLARQKESENCSREVIQRYCIAAFLHYDRGVSSFSQTLSNVNEENCHRYYAFGVFLALGSFARPRDISRGTGGPAQSQIIMSGFLECMDLVRGMHRILSTGKMYRLINLGPMALMLRTQTEDHRPTLDEEAGAEIQLLVAMFQERSQGDKSRVCQEAASLLMRTFAQCTGKPEISKAFYWPSTVSAEYMTLLKTNEPEALLVLAYWCVLLDKISWCWIMEGWPVDLLEGAIAPMLDDTWKAWLRWPSEKVRTE